MYPLLIDRLPGAGHHAGRPGRPQPGFTLVELLVSMVVLSLIMLMTVQMVGSATSVTTASNKVIDTESMARIALDRIGNDLTNASLTGGPTLVYYSGSSGQIIDPAQNSEFGFVCKTRGRKINSATPAPGGPPTPSQDARGIIVGYKIRPTPITILSQAPVNIPLINRGDALFTFGQTGTQGTDKYGFSLWNMFGVSGTASLVNDLITTNISLDSSLLTWNGFGDGIVRLHVSFVLDDGRVVQSLQQPGLSPPVNATYSGFSANNGTGDCVPVAFSAATTADVSKRYVSGLIVGIAILDQTTLNTNFSRDNTFISTLSTQLKRPVNNGDTPLGIWQANLSNVTPLSAKQNIRFYQRFYSVNP